MCCNKKTAWYCVGCTTNPHDICPVCPSETRGGGKGGKGTKQHVCECAHARNPDFRFGKRNQAKARGKRQRVEAEAEEEEEEEDEGPQFESGSDAEGSGEED